MYLLLRELCTLLNKFLLLNESRLLTALLILYAPLILRPFIFSENGKNISGALFNIDVYSNGNFRNIFIIEPVCTYTAPFGIFP